MLKIKDHICFDEKTHTYINSENGLVYTSGTTFTSKYKEKFVASESKTEKERLKSGLTHEQVVEMWNNNNEKSTTRGTAIHLYIEELIKKIDHNQDNLLLLDELEKEQILNYLTSQKLIRRKKQRGEYPKFHVEDILWNDENEIAGQTDLLIEYKDYLIIKDWKTNQKTIEELRSTYTNPYSLKQKKMLGEFNWLNENKFNGYILQLSLYAVLAEQYYKKPVKNIYIVHINKEVNEYKVEKDLFEKVKNQFKEILNIK